MLAVCIQHEMDHLMGKVFVDYLSRAQARRIAGQARRRAARGERPRRGRGRRGVASTPRRRLAGRCASIFAGTPEFAAPRARRARRRRPRQSRWC
ncbi:MAG: peptide deformylase [Comamonadaceae bacterium]|nr:peptide deformylase [Comamonadaceae bacterium]